MGAHRARIGAGVRLGETEAPDDLARVHRRQPTLLLLLRSELPDGEHREGALHGDGAADARIARFELHARQAVGDGAGAGEAVAVEVHPEQTELRELLEDLAREDAFLEPVPDLVEDVVAHELPDRVANRALLVVEQCVDCEVVERVESGTLGGRRHAPDILRKSASALDRLPTARVDSG